MHLLRIVVAAASLALLLSSCAGSKKTTKAAHKPTAAPAAEAGGTVELPVIRLGQEADLQGFTGVNVFETGLSVFLKKTRWSEVEIDGKKFREGYADLGVRSEAGTETLRIDVGEKARSRGYEIEVTYIGDVYDDRTGRKKPHAKVIVRRP